MRLLHCADLHLGMRQYTRLTAAGLNVRECDIGATFSRFVTAAIAERPDVIVIAGDCFHAPRPSNHAVVLAFREFERLTKALPETPICVAAGNHDLGKTADVGCILDLFVGLGLHIATYNAMRFTFPALELSVLCVPDVAGKERPSLTPDADARYNVAVIHGELQGVSQGGAEYRANLREISREELGDAWDYVALGHFHQYERLAPNVAYAGSLDYCSSNPWQESTRKGFVIHDLATGAHEFHAIEPTRPFIDLEPIIAQGMTPAEVDAAIAERVTGIPLAGSVVRLIVDGITRDVEKGLDQKALRKLALSALQFRLDCRRPVAAIRTIAEVTTRRKQELESLVTRVERVLRARELPGDVDRETLVAAALGYMDQTLNQIGEQAETPAPPDAESRDTVLVRQLQTSIDQNSLKRSA